MIPLAELSTEIMTYHCYRGSANRMRQPKPLVLEISISSTSGGKGQSLHARLTQVTHTWMR